MIKPKLNSAISNFQQKYVFFTTDINECELDVDRCATNATCSNTEGSYECSCTTGFIGDGNICCALIKRLVILMHTLLLCYVMHIELTFNDLCWRK